MIKLLIRIAKKSNLPLSSKRRRSISPKRTAVAPISASKSPYKSDEAIDKLQERVGLDVIPNSRAPISSKELFTLQWELKNLIGRVESAHLAALANNSAGIAGDIGNNPIYAKAQPVRFASVKTEFMSSNTQKSLFWAKQVANNLPQLVARRQHAQARRQWVKAKISLLRKFPLDKRLAQPEIRAMWLDRGTIVKAKSQQGLAKVFDRMAESGINTVFFETVNSSYTIYPSKVAKLLPNKIH